MTTGTKCVNGEYMSVTGGVLNDSHAEIVARRCLVDFFYSQLELHLNPRKLFYSYLLALMLNNFIHHMLIVFYRNG